MYRICYVLTISSTVKAFFIPQLKYLASNGFDVTVICSNDVMLQEELGDAIRFYPIEIPRGISFKKSIIAIKTLTKFFKEEQFDLIQYSTPNAAFYASIASKKTGCKVRNYHLMGCFVILGISFFSKLAIIILSNSSYLSAATLVPVILFSYFINGENEFFSLGIQIRNKTYITSLIMLVGGISNIFLNIILIPKYGMYGAALATLVSYTIINAINIRISKRLYNVKYNFKRAYTIDFIAIVLYLIYFIISNLINSIVIQLLLGILFLFIYIGIMILFKIISYFELKQVIIKNLN